MDEKSSLPFQLGAADTCRELENEADEVICGIVPNHFEAVGAWYRDFSQTTDEEAADLRHLPR